MSAFIDKLALSIEGALGTSVVVFDKELIVQAFSERAKERFSFLEVGASLAKVFPFFEEHVDDIATARPTGVVPTHLPSGTPSTTVQLSFIGEQTFAWLMPVASDNVESLATLSHEIRTPINTVIGMSELLSTTKLSAAQTKYLNILQGSALSLLDLVNNVLDMQRLSQGHIDLRDEPFYLQEVIDNTLDVLALRAHAKGLELSAVIEPGVPTDLRGDAERLRQVLTNLIGNAVKFTDSGGVSMRVTVDDEQKLCFVVDDTGQGVPNERRSRLFLPFWQLHGASRSAEGTGLGLSISKQIAEAMGGTVWHENLNSGGSRFSFTTALNVQESPVRRTLQAAVPMSNLRVLIVDDNSMGALSVATLLSTWGPRIDVADSQDEALRKLDEARSLGNPFGLVLLDAELQPSGGFSLAQKFLRDEEDLPICMLLTSNNLEQDIQSAESMRLSYVVKPIKKNELLATINRELATERSSAPPPETQPSGEQRKVLYVDDSSANRLYVKTVLTKEGHDVTAFENPTLALDHLADARYDFIILDIQMPGMDGYELARRIRKIEEEQDAEAQPLVALTAYSFQHHIDACYAAGFDRHVAKPVNRRTLLKVVRDMTSEHRSPLHEDASEARMALVRKDYDALSLVADRLLKRPRVAQLGLRMQEAAQQKDRPTLKIVIDAIDSMAQEDVAGLPAPSYAPPPEPLTLSYDEEEDAEVDSALRRLVPAFLARRREELIELDRAIDDKDFASIKTLGHRMAGSGTTYGFEEISRLGAALERAAKAEDAKVARLFTGELAEYLSTLQ